MKLPANAHLLSGCVLTGLISPAFPATAASDVEAMDLIDRLQACITDPQPVPTGTGPNAVQTLQHCAEAVDLQSKTNSSVKTLIAVKIFPQTPADDWSAFDRAAFQDEAEAVIRTAIVESGQFAVAASNSGQSLRYQISAKIEFQATGHGNRYLDQWISLPKRIQLTLELRDQLGLTPTQRREITVKLGPQLRQRSTNVRNSDWFFKASDSVKVSAQELLAAGQASPRLATVERSSNGKLQINSGGYQYINPNTWIVLLPERFKAEGRPWQIAHPIAAQRIATTTAQLLIEPDNGDTRQCAESPCLAWIP